MSSSPPPDNTRFLKDFLDNIKDFPTVPRFILAALVLIAFWALLPLPIIWPLPERPGRPLRLPFHVQH